MTTSPRTDHPEDAAHGARIFVQGKASRLDAAVQLLQAAVAAAAPAAAPEAGPENAEPAEPEAAP